MTRPADQRMVDIAIARGQVLVTHEDRTCLATLIAWRPKRNGKHTKLARVQYPRGTYASVKIENISIPDERKP